jgi:serine/threonine-protein kinase RsbW
MSSVLPSPLFDGAPPSPENWRPDRVHSLQDMEHYLGGVVAQLNEAGYSERDVFSMRLALEEAIVNAIQHGHQGDASKAVSIRRYINGTQMLFEIEDQGPGFQPEKVPNPLAPENLERPSGRGVFLMRHYMTWVRYNERGNCVTMCKRKTG